MGDRNVYFPCSPQLAPEIDLAMREALAESLAHIHSVAGAALGGEDVDLSLALDEIRAHRILPGLFGRYYDLVLAVQAGQFGGATRLMSEICSLASLQPALNVLPFTEPVLGADMIRYGRLVDLDAQTPGLLASPTPEQEKNFPGAVAVALELLEATDAALAAEFRALIVQIVGAIPPAGNPKFKFGGISSYMLWGALFLNIDRHGTPLDLLEGLVHEASHHLLFGLAREEPLVLNAVAERFSSPLRVEPRPMDGVFHAVFVCARLNYLYRRLRDARPKALNPDELRLADARIESFRQRFLGGLATVRAHGLLTATGESILDGCEAYVRSEG